MSNCNEKERCDYSKGPQLVPGPSVAMGCFKPAAQTCKGNKIKTLDLPTQLGTPDDGAEKPAYGAHTDTLVHYQADDSIVFYDSYGQFTRWDGHSAVTNQINALEAGINSLTARVEALEKA